MFLVSLPVLVTISNPGNHCRRESRHDNSIPGECWTRLIYVQVPLSAYDISGIAANCLIIVSAIVSIIASYMRMKVIIYVVGCFMILTALEPIMYTVAVGGVYAASETTPQLTEISSEVHKQMKSSLYAYSAGDAAVTAAWDEIMIKDCCCGVDGFRDFLEIGEKIPDCCTCRAAFYYEPALCYKGSGTCHVDSKYNATSNGCFAHVMDRIEEDRNDCYVAKMIVFLSVSISQLVFVILAMMCTSCCLWVPTKGVSTSGDDDGSVKFVSLPEGGNVKDDLLIYTTDTVVLI